MMQGRMLRMDAIDAGIYRKFCLWQNERLCGLRSLWNMTGDPMCIGMAMCG